MQTLESVEQAVDQIINKLGKKIVMGAPLGAGKPNHLINALYKRAKEDKEISLSICTALTLEKPKPKSDLEGRFLAPFVERVFGDYPDLEYELDRNKKNLPNNIKIIEFYFPPGKYLKDNQSQQNYISSNYTHICRDMMERGINLLVQMVAKKDDLVSLSCNADVSGDMIPQMRASDYPVLIVGQVNQSLPFMYGDADLPAETFDFIVDNPKQYFKIFGPPKMSVTDADYMIGLHASTLVKDDGELQVGIGCLGDAVIYALVLREKNNTAYLKILKETDLLKNFTPIIDKIGGLTPFSTGLFGATEMMVDGFMELYKHKILKKQVYDNFELQKLINEGLLDPQKITEDILDQLMARKLIQSKLTEKDFVFLKYWGIIKKDLSLKDGVIIINQDLFVVPDLNEIHNRKEFIQHCLGEKLRHGNLMHAGFFLGPTKFYQWLKDLPESERKLFAMKSVLKINQLYGHELIDRLHRRNARFINTCMMTTLMGAHVSDGLADGKLVSGVGGQYNFVAMAQELPDGHSIITMRSTRTKKGKVYSNIVFNYGHITVPRHMRDILVTEYGIAYLRGKTDCEIVMELMKVCDSRFQEELCSRAKAAGKLRQDYQVPQEYRNNLPTKYLSALAGLKQEGFFAKFPFGTDLTAEEIKIGGGLKALKANLDNGLKGKMALIFKALCTSPKPEQMKYLERLELANPKNLKERIFQKLVCTQL